MAIKKLTTMHPDTTQLAAYLDAALDEAEQKATRAHVLTCAHCTARLTRLRADAQRISALNSLPTPDLRSAIRQQLGQPRPISWLLRGAGLTGAVVALFLFALLISISSGTLARMPNRLLLLEQHQRQLIELDADNGTIFRRVALDGPPIALTYHQQRNWLYILLAQRIVVLNATTLTEQARWDAPRELGQPVSMVLDESRDRLYVAWPQAEQIGVFEASTLQPARLGGQQAITVGPSPDALLLSADGRTLFTADRQDGQLWSVDLDSGQVTHRSIALTTDNFRRYIALSADGRVLFVLEASTPPSLRRIELSDWQISAPILLDDGPLPWDLVLVDAQQLAIARGDSRVGGVTLFDTEALTVSAVLDYETDQHHLVAGPAGSFFGLNWLHGSVTHYSSTPAPGIGWRSIPQANGRLWEGVFIEGGWRWQ
jgi:hypothetical protein